LLDSLSRSLHEVGTTGDDGDDTRQGFGSGKLFKRPFAEIADAVKCALVHALTKTRKRSEREKLVKTVCTTNTAWGGTVRMVTALVEHLGVAAPGGGRTFPRPAAMAEAGEDFYRDVARAGYRGAYLRALAEDVASGALDLEQLNNPELPIEEIEERLLALPGVGPYAAAHVMLTSLGRYSRLVLDSWTRPTYAKLVGRKASDTTIARTFRRYGDFAGLAFWLLLTRSWVPDDSA
jgi:3-methyladenine DNA glycosylase/8-oxoguanine DNA glycosylase